MPLEIDEELSEINKQYDEQLRKNREILIFYEETRLWREKLDVCLEKYGEDQRLFCTHMAKILDERIQYTNSRFSDDLKPTLSSPLFK